jgi:CubicO group peptidase (beta-lactamase class C family)
MRYEKYEAAVKYHDLHGIPVKWTLILLISLLSTAAFGDAEIPGTPIGKIFAAYIAAFNSNDPKQLLAFKDTYGSQWELQDVLDRRQATGGWRVLRIERNEPLTLSAVVQEKESDQAWRADYSLNSEVPPVTLSAQMKRTELPTDLAIPRLSAAAALAALVKRADSLAKDDKFSGVLLVSRHDKILLMKQWGYADRGAKSPNTLDTRFRLGSMNKMFTAIAALQLVEAGKLSLDGVVGNYIPDYPNKEVASKVTVRHLLTHTGGMGDIFGPEWEKEPGKFKENGDYVQLYGSRAPDQEPGSKFRYSNYGFVLLGALIEKVSGESYYDYVEAHIFKPSGMNSTASLPESVNVPNRAVGYMQDGGVWVSNAATLPYRGMAAGGGYSTAGDLLRFAQALESGKLLSRQLFAEATTRFLKDKPVGYGFMIFGQGPLFNFGHEGGAPGMNAELRVYPTLGYVLVGASNLDPPAAERLVGYYANRMPVTP